MGRGARYQDNSTSGDGGGGGCCDHHPEGMLDRDQRTAKIPLRVANPVCDSCGTKPHRTHAGRTTAYFRTLQRVKQVLVITTYLLSIVHVPGCLSAPTSRHMASRSDSPKWINPCSFRDETFTETIEPIESPVLMQQIISQAALALNKAKEFMEAYTGSTFKSDSQTSHLMWKSHRYEWLPSHKEIPKGLGENAQAEVLEKLQLKEFLIQIYESLQKLAVGLEQIVWDQEDHEGPFVKIFQEMEFYLKAVLCETQSAMAEMNLKQRPDITRELMSEPYRVMTNESDRNIRDWLIYRDYMNALEYTIQAITHLQKNLQA